jgi:hypothetical protein
VSQDISLEDGSVVEVKSELPDFPEESWLLNLDILRCSSEEVDPPLLDSAFILFLRILWTLEASCTVCRVSL